MLLDLSGRKALVPAIAHQLERQWGQLDILVHYLAFANKADLVGDFSGMNDPIFRGCG